MNYFTRIFISAVFSCIFVSFCWGSTSADDPPYGIASYHFFHIRDTLNKGIIHEEDFQLVFDAGKSAYSSFTKHIQDSVFLAKIEASERSGSSHTDMGIFTPVTTDQIYTLQSKHMQYINKNFDNQNYLIKEDLEQTNWKVMQETKTILGYPCQMARGMCKGREYTAWFTTDISAGFGPWKLHGLPGLILEAYDDRQMIKFTCTKVMLDVKASGNQILDLPKDVITTTYRDYERMENAFMQGLDIGEFSGGEAVVEKVEVDQGIQTKLQRKVRINYPLELDQVKK
ncbi:GLPGLI family protein [Chryseobacterium sp. ISL-6]|uniref:GLPGLI family protein n=1 Tax=Chryseobacterium sp. ISL-6 TaxID=2819143 RepID=UPI001BEC4473|nr:GLPGLI family protein [Chryseobacterium sp. ISL-6]MBT2621923.1 GLPGLI family protein [Chryseobacterium sp. ISL-6]